MTNAADVARFWSKVDRRADEECWPWLASRSRYGYGQFHFAQEGRRVNRCAHRVAYALTNGECPPLLDHTCHNRACVNPSHLRPATNKQNMENVIAPNKNNRNGSGYRGVYRQGNRWVAMVKHNYKAHYFGRYSTPEAAHEAVVAGRKSLFTFNDHDRAVN